MESTAFAFDEYGGPIAPRPVEIPAPTGREVVVAVSHCGVCHTDVHVHEGGYDVGNGRRVRFEDRGLKPPIVLGHEIVGEVVAAGPEARDVEPGRRYLVFPWIGCGECHACAAGDENLCRKPRFLGVFRPGGYQTLLSVPDARYLVDVTGIDPALAATFGCSGLTTWSAIAKVTPLAEGDFIAVVGCGGLGQMALKLLAATGIDRVIAVDVSAGKRALAEATGAVAIDPAGEDAPARLSKAAGGRLAAVLDFVGNEATSALSLASLRKGGTYVVVGLYGGELRFPLPFLPIQALTVTGSYVGRLDQLKAFVEWARSVDLATIPIETRPLEAAGMALSDLEAGRVEGRVVLTGGGAGA